MKTEQIKEIIQRLYDTRHKARKQMKNAGALEVELTEVIRILEEAVYPPSPQPDLSFLGM